MSNIYHDFFQKLKLYLEILEIDKKHHGINNCSDEEIENLTVKYGKLPTAFEEYLKSIGKTLLFEFMNAENMSYEGLDYAEEFSKEVFEENKISFNRPLLVISERRNDYVSFIYLDENENPSVWITSHYWDDEFEKEKNLSKRTNKFTDIFLSFFNSTLNDFTATFHFVNDEEKNENENVVRDRYMNWFRNLLKVNEIIKLKKEDNLLIAELNNIFLSYYIPGEETIKKELAEDDQRKKLEYLKNNKPNSILDRIKKFFN